MGFADDVAESGENDNSAEASEGQTVAAPEMPQTTGAEGQAAENGSANASTTGETTKESSEDWRSLLNDDARAWADKKGFTDLNDVLRGHENLERLKGVPEDRLLRIPSEDDTEGWNAVFERLGRPSEAKDYGIEDEQVASLFRDSNLTKEQAAKVWEGLSEYQNKQSESQAEEFLRDIELGEQEVYKEWGIEKENNTRFAQQGAKRMGLTADDVFAAEQALGPKKVMNMLAEFGRKTGDPQFAGSETREGSLGLTPEHAKQSLSDLRADPKWQKDMLSNDPKTREKAREKQRKLLVAIGDD